MENKRLRLQYPLEPELSGQKNSANDPTIDVNQANLDSRFLILQPYSVKPGKVKVEGLKVGESTSVTISPVTEQESAFYIVLPARPVKIDLVHNWTGGDYLPELNAIRAGGAAETVVTNAVFNGLKRKGTQKIIETIDTLSGGGAQTILQHVGKGTFTPQRKFYTGTDPFGFSFSWTLSPRSVKEAKVIRKIVDVFKYYTTAQDPANNSENILLVNQPPYWKLTYVNGDGEGSNPELVENLFFNKNEIDDLVCTEVGVEYSEGDIYTTFPDDFPSVIKLSLTFEMSSNIRSAQKLFGQIDKDLRMISKDNKPKGNNT